MSSRRVEVRDPDGPVRMKHLALQSGSEGVAKHFFLVCSAFELRCPHRELDARLWIHIEEAARSGRKLARARTLRLGTRVAPLHEREDGDRSNENETDDCRGGHTERATSAALGVVNRAFGPITGTPTRDRIGEHVVIDLVSGPRTVLGAGTNDPFGCKLPQDISSLLLSDLGVTGEIAGAMRDLRSGRRDEEVVHRGRGVLLPGREICHRVLEVVLDDLRGAAELGERLSPEEPRATLGLDLPQPAHDELQVRRLDAIVVSRGGDDTPAHRSELDSPGRNFVENSIDESWFQVDPAFGGDELVVSLQGTADRRLPGRTVEVLQPQTVRKEVGNHRLEAVEQGKSVFANSDQHVHTQIRPANHVGQLLDEAAILLVVEEELLELIEHQVDVAPRTRCQIRERLTGIADPRGVNPDVDTRLLAKLVRDTGSQHGRLADAGRSEQHRQARGHQVRRDHLAVAVAPEEEQRVDSGVFERREALVGRGRSRYLAHAFASVRSMPA